MVFSGLQHSGKVVYTGSMVSYWLLCVASIVVFLCVSVCGTTVLCQNGAMLRIGR